MELEFDAPGRNFNVAERPSVIYPPWARSFARRTARRIAYVRKANPSEIESLPRRWAKVTHRCDPGVARIRWKPCKKIAESKSKQAGRNPCRVSRRVGQAPGVSLTSSVKLRDFEVAWETRESIERICLEESTHGLGRAASFFFFSSGENRSRSGPGRRNLRVVPCFVIC